MAPEQRESRVGLHGDQRQLVSEHVVQILGNPQPFFTGTPPGVLQAGLLCLGTALRLRAAGPAADAGDLGRGASTSSQAARASRAAGEISSACVRGLTNVRRNPATRTA